MDLKDFELVSQVNQEDDGYFSWSGCDNVLAHGGKRLGGTVYACQGYKTLKEAQADPEGNLYEFNLCFDCLYEHEYGERPE